LPPGANKNRKNHKKRLSLFWYNRYEGRETRNGHGDFKNLYLQPLHTVWPAFFPPSFGYEYRF